MIIYIEIVTGGVLAHFWYVRLKQLMHTPVFAFGRTTFSLLSQETALLTRVGLIFFSKLIDSSMTASDFVESEKFAPRNLLHQNY